MGLNFHYIIDLAQVYREDEDSVGKKAFELGELMYLGIPIPEGFVIKTSFYKKFLEITGISEDFKKIKKTYHPSLKYCVKELFEPIRKKVMHTHIPYDLVLEFHKFYRKLAGKFKETSVNIFSSSQTNKSVVFSNIKGDANVVLKIKTIWSSCFDNPASVIIMKNFQSAIKGKVFTDCPTLDKKLSKEQMDKLIKYCKTIQKHFYFPKEIEYVVVKNQLFITRINPFTGSVSQLFKLKDQNKRLPKILIKGISINPGIVTGPVRVLRGKYGNSEIKRGEVAMLSNLDTSLFKRIKSAKAVVVDSILTNPLSKTFYRKDFHIPTVEGAKNATKMFQNGNIVTVNGVTGEIYSGGLIY